MVEMVKMVQMVKMVKMVKMLSGSGRRTGGKTDCKNEETNY